MIDSQLRFIIFDEDLQLQINEITFNLADFIGIDHVPGC